MNKGKEMKLFVSLVFIISVANAQGGGSLAVADADGTYGNDVKARGNRHSGGAMKIWLMTDRQLPEGKLESFYVYLHPGNASDGTNSSLKLQIWRQASEDINSYLLVFEKAVTVDTTSAGSFQTYFLSSTETFYTEKDDVIGWTTGRDVGIVSFDYVEGRTVRFRSVPSNGPVLGTHYAFPVQQFPAEYSVAVKINRLIACYQISSPFCTSSQLYRLGYNKTSFPNFFGHSSLAEAASNLNRFQDLVRSNCHVSLDEFLCMLYYPQCGSHKRPCADLCRAVKQGCSATMEELEMSWPNQLDCDNLPNDDTCQKIGCDESFQFTCSNEQCIFSAWLCDGQADCTDNSDEHLAMCAAMPCRDDEFDCRSNRENGEFPACISRDKICDEEVDCVEGEDEEQDCEVEATCAAGLYMCENGECIPGALRCNHIADCQHADDEQDCDYPECTTDQFQCHSEQCIDQDLQCNGFWDCSDGTDERTPSGHPRPDCITEQDCDRLEHFFCGSGDCISSSLVCNDNNDCDDGSDEDSDVCENLGRSDCASSPCEDICHETVVSYYCSCNEGRTLGLDEKSCFDIDECTNTPLECGQTCMNSVGSFACSCQEGYRPSTADPTACVTAAGSVEAWMIFSNQLYIRRYDLDEGTLDSITDTHHLTHVLDFDYAEQRYYYADARLRQISSMNFDGTDVRIVNQHQTLSVEGIAVDWIAKNIYWTSTNLDGIYVSKVDGRFSSHLLRDVSEYIRGITLDPRVGLLFWTDWSLEAFIGRAGTDGSDHKKLITESIFWPNGITIDYTTSRIFWIDAHMDRVESSDYEGNYRYVIVQEASHGYALTVFEDTVYWTEWNLKQVEKANKRTGEGRELLLELSHVPFGIHIVHPLLRPEQTHPCQVNNGGCSQLCLVAPGENKVTCACSRYFELLPDNVTCVGRCNAAQYECGAPDHKCIPLRWFCDGEADCADGVDEPANHEKCIHRVCPPGYHQCDNSSLSPYCILPSQVCDQTAQCGDGSDEAEALCADRVCAPYEFRCGSGQCLPQSYACDDEVDCGDSTDEAPINTNCIKRSCDADEFTCDNGLCIPQLWVCDWDDDCGDLSDEPRSWCWNNTKCPDGWTRCRSNYRCIPELAFCNGFDNCRDNSDEEEHRCPTTCDTGDYMCDDGSCIPMRWYCDFSEDCDDGSDEGIERCDGIYPNCTEVEFRCNDQRCIRQDRVCDFTNHCPGGEDEVGCENNTACADDKFRCDSGHCIPGDYHCDQYADCEDGSDEHKVKCPPPYENGRYCPVDRFECAETGICIPPSYQCDGVDDCYDNSDEQNCEDWTCHGANRFHCKSGHCIYGTQVCDGDNDCEGGEDESTEKGGVCHPTRCDFEQFTCADGSGCINKRLLCNRRPDCADGSDESVCYNSTHGRCEENNGGCAEKCNNLRDGNFYCSCDLPGTRTTPSDPRNCEDLDECEEFLANNCTQTCVNQVKSYYCECVQGFIPSSNNEDNCLPEDETEYFALVGNGHEFRQYYFSDDSIGSVVIGQRSVGAIDVDIVNRVAYFADTQRQKILRTAIPHNRADLGNAQELSIQGDQILSPSGVAYEWKGRLLFWSDSSKHLIGVVTHDGNYRKTVVSGQNFYPDSVQVDSEIGHLYWINRGTNVTLIEKSWTNGQDREVLVSTDMRRPVGLTIDHHQDHRVFWCDILRLTIESVNYDGSDRVIVYNLEDVPASVDVFGSSLFWIARQQQSVMTRGKKADEESRSLLDNMFFLNSVRIYNPRRYNTDVRNQCRRRNGQPLCHYLCFALPNDAYSCECPDGATVQPGGRGEDQCATVLPYNPLDDPELCTCGGHGYCTVTTAAQATCVCDEGYSGDNCQSTGTLAPTAPTAPPTAPTAPPTAPTAPPTAPTAPPTAPSSTQAPATTTKKASGTKKNTGGGGGGDDTAAIVVPIFIILIILVVVVVAVLFWLRKKGKLGKPHHARYERDPTLDGSAYDDPSMESADGTNMREIQFENGGNVRFSNPMYEKPEAPKEEISGQGYVTVSDINLTENDGSKS